MSHYEATCFHPNNLDHIFSFSGQLVLADCLSVCVCVCGDGREERVGGARTVSAGLGLNAAVPRWTRCLSLSGRTRRFVIGGPKRKKK